MVHKRAIILIVVAIVVCCSALVIGLLSDDEDGVTVASREAILQDLPKGIDWQIASEILIDDYLLSSIYSPTKDGVAIFAPQKNGGYEYQSIHYANKGDIVIAHVITNQSYYDIFYLGSSRFVLCRSYLHCRWTAVGAGTIRLGRRQNLLSSSSK